MKFHMTKIAAAAAMVAASGGAQAALQNGSVLNLGAGSAFIMEVAPGFFLSTSITNNDGLILGTAQAATGSHTGAPNGTESAGIDDPWLFFGNTGMHQSVSATNVLSASGNTATVDFSGWSVTWNGISNIPMGTGAWNNAATPIGAFSGMQNGIAQVTCGVNCGDGDTFTLLYTARVPVGDPSNFGGVAYGLKLTGTVAAVPEASTYGMMLAGLGLVGFAVRRRKLMA